MNSLDALAGAVRDGAGIVRLSSWLVQKDLATGRRQRLLIDHEAASTRLDLAFQPSRLASTKMRAFVDYLAERWWSAGSLGAPACTAIRNSELIFNSKFI